MNVDRAQTVVAALSLLGSAAVLAVAVDRFSGNSAPLPTEYDLDKVCGLRV